MLPPHQGSNKPSNNPDEAESLSSLAQRAMLDSSSSSSRATNPNNANDHSARGATVETGESLAGSFGRAANANNSSSSSTLGALQQGTPFVNSALGDKLRELILNQSLLLGTNAVNPAWQQQLETFGYGAGNRSNNNLPLFRDVQFQEKPAAINPLDQGASMNPIESFLKSLAGTGPSSRNEKGESIAQNPNLFHFDKDGSWRVAQTLRHQEQQQDRPASAFTGGNGFQKPTEASLSSSSQKRSESSLHLASEKELDQQNTLSSSAGVTASTRLVACPARRMPADHIFSVGLFVTAFEYAAIHFV